MGCRRCNLGRRATCQADMAFDSDPLQTRFEDHTYFSKEGASGGYRGRRRLRVQLMATPSKPAPFSRPHWRFPASCRRRTRRSPCRTRRLIQFKYLYYKDYQAVRYRRQQRRRSDDVNSPALYMLAPISEAGCSRSVRCTTTSGCVAVLPLGAFGRVWKGVEDKRTAGDITVTKYFGRTALSVRGAYSTEDDYKSTRVASRCAMRRRIRTPRSRRPWLFVRRNVSPTMDRSFRAARVRSTASSAITQVLTPNDRG